jgi:iron-sulfur cluster assembly protein
MFTLTPAAARKIHEAASAGGTEGMALRIAARQGPDGSIEYGMGFDDSGEHDMRLLLEGISVLISEQHKDLLDDTVLDFVELNPGEFNFIFIDALQAASAPPEPVSQGCGSGGCGSCSSKGVTH